VDLIMQDQAVVRTFFSRFDSGGDDDFLTLKLEGARDLGQSQFAALSVQASIDGAGDPVDGHLPGVQSNCRRVSVSSLSCTLQSTGQRTEFIVISTGRLPSTKSPSVTALPV
jgi:hypothetical protein